MQTGTEGKTIKDLIFGFDDRFEKLAEEIKRVARKGDKVLDIGCGEGKIWQMFPELDVTGVDISSNNLDKAKKNLRVTKGTAEELRFKDNSFDLVVASEILEHLFQPERALGEIERVLKGNGVAIITFPNTGALQIRLGLLLWGRNPSINYPANMQHIRFFNLLDMKEMLRMTNFQIEKIRGCSFLSFHKQNFDLYIPVPRKIRTIGGDLFPQFSFGNLLVLRKQGFKEGLSCYWNKQEYIIAAGKKPLTFKNNTGFSLLKDYSAKARSVLDCGCGNGTTIEMIWQENTSFFGIDFSEKAIKAGKQRLEKRKNIHLNVGDIESINFPAEIFDLVYSAYTLEHLDNPEKVIKEMIRVTKKNGCLILIAPNYGSPISHSPSSPPRGETLVTRSVKQFLKSHLYLLRRPKALDWLRTEPLCSREKRWQPDWDTVTEPYLQTLLYFLIENGLEIVEFRTHLVGGKEREIKPPTVRNKLLRLAKKTVMIMEKMRIPPYKYYGPDFFIVGRKE